MRLTQKVSDVTDERDNGSNGKRIGSQQPISKVRMDAGADVAQGTAGHI